MDLMQLNSIAMDWDPAPVLMALQQFGGGAGAAAPQFAGMPNPEGAPQPGTDLQPPIPQAPQTVPSLDGILNGQQAQAPGAPTAAGKGAAPMSIQQQQALAAMMPKKGVEPVRAPPPIAPHNSTRPIQFSQFAPPPSGGSAVTPSLAAILSGRRA